MGPGKQALPPPPLHPAPTPAVPPVSHIRTGAAEGRPWPLDSVFLEPGRLSFICLATSSSQSPVAPIDREAGQNYTDGSSYGDQCLPIVLSEDFTVESCLAPLTTYPEWVCDPRPSLQSPQPHPTPPQPPGLTQWWVTQQDATSKPSWSQVTDIARSVGIPKSKDYPGVPEPRAGRQEASSAENRAERRRERTEERVGADGGRNIWVLGSWGPTTPMQRCLQAFHHTSLRYVLSFSLSITQAYEMPSLSLFHSPGR